jgi:hypothetical protein
MTTAIEIHTDLLELEADRALASIEGLATDLSRRGQPCRRIEAMARASWLLFLAGGVFVGRVPPAEQYRRQIEAG